MKRRLLTFAAGAVAAVVLCTATFALAGTSFSVLHLTAKANHKTFTVPMNTAIFITLKSPGSDGGYSWRRGSSSGVRLVSHRVITKKIPGCTGVPCTSVKEIWRFKAVGTSGNGKIQLRYAQMRGKATRTFSVKLNIS